MAIEIQGGNSDSSLNIEEKLQGVYILHFSQKIDRDLYRHYRRYGDQLHYVGQSTDIVKRLNLHKEGKGSKVTQAVVDRGIHISLASVFPIGLVKEEQIITRIGATKLCSICQIQKLGTEIKVESGYQMFLVRGYRTCDFCNGKQIREGQAAAYNKETGKTVHYYHVRQEV